MGVPLALRPNDRDNAGATGDYEGAEGIEGDIDDLVRWDRHILGTFYLPDDKVRT